MIYFIMKGQIFTIFLSLAHLTSISFPSKVIDYVGGQEGDFKIYELNKNKSLVYEPKSKDFSRNFISFLKEEKFHYNLKYNEQLADKDVTLKRAETCGYYSLILESDTFQLFECPKSLLLKNKTNTPLLVNDMTVVSSSYISKGPPVYVNNRLIYFRGQIL